MKRMIANLMIVLCATVGLSLAGASDAEAGGKHWKKHHGHHHHERHWDWDHHRRHERRHFRRHVSHRAHVHDAHCGHGYYDRYGVYHLYTGNGLIEINLGALLGGR